MDTNIDMLFRRARVTVASTGRRRAPLLRGAVKIMRSRFKTGPLTLAVAITYHPCAVPLDSTALCTSEEQ